MDRIDWTQEKIDALLKKYSETEDDEIWIDTTLQNMGKRIEELEAKNTSLQATMEAVIKAASASISLDVIDHLYRKIQECDELKRENKQVKIAIEDLQDKLRNGIEYDEENNQYILCWTKREIDEAKVEADRICKVLKFD